MAVGSNVNPNYPIPGIDQSSKGFRDNFSTIKVEIENLQAKNIVLVGDATGNAIIDGGTGDVTIVTTVTASNVSAASPDRGVQFNNGGYLGAQSYLTWDPALVLNVGEQSADSYYWADLGETKVHNELLVQGDYIDSLLTIAANDGNTPVFTLLATTGNVVATVSDSYPLRLLGNGNTIAVFTEQGVSIGTQNTASVRLSVHEGAQSNIALFSSTLDNSDNVVRLETSKPNSTVGVLLQQTSANQAGGMRIDQHGNITIHSGANDGAWLADSTTKMLLTPTGELGIGITDPACRLDVDGGMQWNLPNSANVAPHSVDIVGVAIDSWDMSIYRSADYTVQCTDSSGAVEITKMMVMHQSGVAHQYIYANLNSGGGGLGPTTLGTIVAAVNGSQMQLVYSGIAPGNIVKCDAVYVTL